MYKTGSTLYKVSDNGERKPVLWWDKKGNGNGFDLDEMIKAVGKINSVGKIQTLPSDLPRNDRCNSVYVVADFHNGMMSWGRETGRDWDLDISRRVITKRFAKLCARTSPSKDATLVILGDFFHTDGVKPVTVASGHLLDVDSRWGKIYETGFSILGTMIANLSERHEKISIFIVQGNHDEASSQTVSHALAAVYAKEKRVTVNNSSSKFLGFRYGNSFIGMHHGNVKSVNSLPMVFDSTFRDWGRTKHRYIYIGHRHKRVVTEMPNCILEQFQAACPADSYAHKSGFVSSASICSIVIDAKEGEITRNTVRI